MAAAILGGVIAALPRLTGAVVDPATVRLCRAILPAIAPPGTLVVTGVAPGSGAGRVRIEYRSEGEDRQAHARFADCLIGPDPEAGGAPGLLAVSTDSGPLGSARLFLLKRYYLDSPDGAARNIATPDPSGDLPVLARPLAVALALGLAALPNLAVYGLLAGAYALVYGLSGRINLAFGEIASVGAAAAGLAFAGLLAATGGSALAALVAAPVVGLLAAAVHGLVTGHLSINCVRRREAGGRAAAGQASLIATIGVALALSEYLRLAAGPSPRWIPPFWSGAVPIARSGDYVVAVAPGSLGTALAGFAASAGLVGLMHASGFGRAWRAAAQDARAAALFGVDRARLTTLTLLLAGAAAGLAGALVAVQYGALGFAGGLGLGLKALAGTVLGGIGSVPGALAGGVAIGIVEALWSGLMPIASRDLALDVLLVAAMIVWPNGVLRPRHEDRMP